jgi:hypothetical protein
MRAGCAASTACCVRAGPTALADEIGVTPAVSPKFPNISIPYGALVPQQLDGLLACGRHVSCDKNSHGFMREIPQCWITGQAAGVGALQAELVKQGVVLREHATQAAGLPRAA